MGNVRYYTFPCCDRMRCKCAMGFRYGIWTRSIAPIAEVGEGSNFGERINQNGEINV